MSPSTDVKLTEERLRCYRGIARVSLRSLSFQHALVQDKHRAISQENVLRIENIFKHNGCLRLQEEHVINAVVQDDDLAAALSKQGITKEDFRGYQWAQDAPLLELSDVQCLSGLHRVEAAHRYLDDNDKWWIVRLFSYDTPKTTLLRIIESCAYEQRPSDGEIFRKIRLYHRRKDEDSENRWWACLEKSKPRDLRQLIKRRTLVSAFDALIDMPGLWAKVHIGALHRLLVLRCDEEMVFYLNYIAKAWKEILQCGTQTLPFSVVDATTVQHLELLAPKYSSTDKDLVEDLMHRGVLFPSQSNARVRDTLLENICAFQGLIPSLRAFFEILKYLEPSCEALKKLLDKRLKSTIRSSLKGLFWAPEQPCVQVSESRHVEIRSKLNEDEQFKMAYTDLWAFCCRHFDGLTAFTPLKGPSESKPVTNGPNPVTWYHFAQFSLLRGFRIPNAHKIVAMGEQCYVQIALEYLRKAHPTCSQFSKQHIEHVVRSSQAAHSDENDGSAILDSEYLPPERRIGRPYAIDFIKEKKILFIAHLFDTQLSRGVTLTFVRRELFSCLFGHYQLQVDFGQSVSSIPVAAEAMEVDTEYHAEDRAASQLMRDLETLKRTHREMELRHNNVIEENRALCEEAKRKLQQELEASEAKYTELERKHRSLLDVSKQLLSEQATLKRERAELDEILARQQQTELVRSEDYEPLAIEAESVPILEEMTPEAEVALLDSQNVKRWDVNTEDYNQYELFVGSHNDTDGCPIGRNFYVTQTADEGITNVASIMEAAKEHFRGVQLSAFTVLGKRLPNLEPSYIFSAFSQLQRTIFLAPESVALRYVASAKISIAAQADGTMPSVLTVANTAIVGNSKRRLEEENIVVTKESKSERDITVFAAGEDPEGNKRRILKLKKTTKTSINTPVVSPTANLMDDKDASGNASDSSEL